MILSNFLSEEESDMMYVMLIDEVMESLNDWESFA